MRIEYHLTAEDYAEASRRHRISLAYLISICGAIICVILLPQALWPQVPPVNPGPTPPASLLNDLILPMLPWLAILFFVWIIVFRGLRRAGPKPWKKRYRSRTGHSPVATWISIVLVTAIILALTLWTIAAKRQALAALGASADPTFSPVFDTLLPLAPILLVFGLLIFFIPRVISPKRLWSKQIHLHRPFTAQIDDQKLGFSEPLSSHEYAWDYFAGFVQTPNLFVLYPSPLVFFMIPKRAFPSANAQRWFAELLNIHVNERTNAFPVMPGPNPLPLPLPPPAVDSRKVGFPRE